MASRSDGTAGNRALVVSMDICREMKADEMQAWDSFVLSSPFGHLFQTCAWGEIARLQGWEPRRYLIQRDGAIALTAQILLRRKGPFSLLYVPRGPIFRDRDSFDCFISALKKLMGEYRAVTCRINPAVPSSDDTRALFAANGLRKSDRRELHVCTYLIDLSKDLEQIRKNFSELVSRKIKKAEKARVVVENGIDEEQLKNFYAVYETLGEEGKTGVAPYALFREIVRRVPGNVRFFNALVDGKPAATECVLLYGKKGEMMWGASPNVENDVGASRLLRWRIIGWLKENGCAFYDLGGVPPQKDELSGIQFFKRSFGGELVEYAGEYELPGNPILFELWRLFGGFYLRSRKAAG